jgi:hypothetical protein
MSSTRHEEVYHAAHRCQAASLSLTASRGRGRKWACQVENKKTAGFFVRLDRWSLDHRFLGSSARMMVLCNGYFFINQLTGFCNRSSDHPMARHVQNSDT